jgi:hypothetical protein
VWTYSNVKALRDALTQPFFHYSQKRKQLCGRQNASSETGKKHIFQGAYQVTEKNCDPEIDVESGLGNPDCGPAEKQLSIVICECRPAAGCAPQHQQTGTDKEYR